MQSPLEKQPKVDSVTIHTLTGAMGSGMLRGRRAGARRAGATESGTEITPPFVAKPIKGKGEMVR